MGFWPPQQSVDQEKSRLPPQIRQPEEELELEGGCRNRGTATRDRL